MHNTAVKVILTRYSKNGQPSKCCKKISKCFYFVKLLASIE